MKKILAAAALAALLGSGAYAGLFDSVFGGATAGFASDTVKTVIDG